MCWWSLVVDAAVHDRLCDPNGAVMALAFAFPLVLEDGVGCLFGGSWSSAVGAEGGVVSGDVHDGPRGSTVIGVEEDIITSLWCPLSKGDSSHHQVGKEVGRHVDASLV